MKLGVCVPYRDRELHLNEFVPKVGKYLKDRNIDFQMYFCHQVDDKLFNRGATKNIAAKHAFEEGCDYIVWHDIDMIPEDGADYTYPEDNPRHIATKISQMDYGLKYHEYFGGAVLFTKKQAEATNGYSNEYWDWGMEDDDLFWRCHMEGMTNDTYLDKGERTQRYASFNGDSSVIRIPFERKYRGLTSRSHTISALVRCYHQLDKNKIFLIGDKKNRYVEYPIFRLPGYDYGLSFNNSRALSLTYWNNFQQHNYMWIKRYDNQWSWITATFDAENKTSHFYLNGSEVDSKAGFGSPSPHTWIGTLKNYGISDIYLGHTPTFPDKYHGYFKGDIAKTFAWKRCLTPEEVMNLHKDIPKDDLVLDLDFNDPKSAFNAKDIQFKKDSFKIPNSIIPHRVDGKFRCLPHKDEGLVNGKWAKGETTARNERRYVLQMQQGKVNYKEDGLKQVKYELVGEEKLTPWAKMINIKL
jgi:hypothetical protein